MNYPKEYTYTRSIPAPFLNGCVCGHNINIRSTIHYNSKRRLIQVFDAKAPVINISLKR